MDQFMNLDLPSAKHGPFHSCYYCSYHIRSNGLVPSVSDHNFIATYNLLNLLSKLGLKTEGAQL
jgi:hypothetical protein